VCDLQVDFIPGRTKHPTACLAKGIASVSTGTVRRDGVDLTLATSLRVQARAAEAEFFARSKAGGKPVTRLAWKIGDASGAFDLAHLTVAFSGAAGAVVTVDVSADRAFQGAWDGRGHNELELVIDYEEAYIFTGESFGTPGRHALIALLDSKVQPRSEPQTSGTMAHELGHALRMCVAATEGGDPGYDTPGLDVTSHGRHYVFAGNHCADGLSDEDFRLLSTLPADFKWNSIDTGSKTIDLEEVCKCLMYGRGNKRGNSYCSRCRPFLLAATPEF
jgi:hypothetical protein